MNNEGKSIIIGLAVTAFLAYVGITATITAVFGVITLMCVIQEYMILSFIDKVKDSINTKTMRTLVEISLADNLIKDLDLNKSNQSLSKYLTMAVVIGVMALWVDYVAPAYIFSAYMAIQAAVKSLGIIHSKYKALVPLVYKT